MGRGFGGRIAEEIDKKEGQLREADRVAALLEAVWLDSGSQWWVVAGEREGKLRPGGGLVEEILLVEMNKGKLGTVLFYEPRQIDDLVKEAPLMGSPLDTLLGQRRLTVRELGLEGDFEIMAGKMDLMLTEALGVKIDGLIGIKLSQEESLESWWNQMSGISEVRQWGSWLEAQKKLLEERRIRVWLRTANAQELVKELGWAGNLGLPDCRKVFGDNDCVSDGIQILLTDTGSSEEKNFWRMNSQQEIVIGENRVMHSGEWTLENVSGSGGDIYWQWLVPSGAFNVQLWEAGVQTRLDDNMGKVVRVDKDSRKTLRLSYELAKEASSEFGLSFRQKLPDEIAMTSTRLRVKKEGEGNWTLLSPMPTLDGDELMFSHEGGDDMLVVVQLQ
ncbi:hypothetical protein FWH30_00395 [Microgenomates group bacterium]|nr:hypothetical protein [Microgenomates group bacterium]